ncbi:MAG: Maf family protein [Actinobacteria bacterium]|nr:septum formation inhibitor Maf [Ilumatobacteraceae bacterium]MDA0299979.1 Maf family protein [Actinomycetota bacterium]MDA2995475.1 Maf family protein [Actinomycetota bacterium]
MADVVLASGSPRRKSMLADLEVDFVVVPADVDESTVMGESAIDYVQRVATLKATTVSLAHPLDVVLAADTTVDRDGTILAKPIDDDDATSMLRSLSGREHLTHTAVCVASAGTIKTALVSTAVTFRALSDEEINWYVGTGEPLDKAGAYGIQGRAAGFVASISGSVSNVVGLPLAETTELLRTVGVRVAGTSKLMS